MTETIVEVTMTFEHKDGSRRRQVLRGEEAKTWQADVDGCIQMSELHGRPLGFHHWEDEDEGDAK